MDTLPVEVVTYYNVFGYNVWLRNPNDYNNNDDPVRSGGNSDACSEEILVPLWAGETYDSPHDARLPLNTIKQYATNAHNEVRLEYPDAVDCGVFKDTDSQDEWLIMLSMEAHPLMSSAYKKRRAAKRAPVLALRKATLTQLKELDRVEAARRSAWYKALSAASKTNAARLRADKEHAIDYAHIDSTCDEPRMSEETQAEYIRLTDVLNSTYDEE